MVEAEWWKKEEFCTDRLWVVVNNYQITGKVQLRETAKNVLDEYSEQRKEDKETWLSKK